MTMRVYTKYVKLFGTKSNNAYENSISALGSVMFKIGWLGAKISDDYFHLEYGFPLEQKVPSDLLYLDQYLSKIVASNGHKIHKLKSDPEWFAMNITGEKMAEMRNNDRDFKVGDLVIIQEHNRRVETPYYTGNVFAARINWVATGEWLQPNNVCFGLEHIHGFINFIDSGY